MPSTSFTTSLTTSFSLAPRPISWAVEPASACWSLMSEVRAAADSWTGVPAGAALPELSAGVTAAALPVVRPVVSRAPAATAVAMARVVRL